MDPDPTPISTPQSPLLLLDIEPRCLAPLRRYLLALGLISTTRNDPLAMRMCLSAWRVLCLAAVSSFLLMDIVGLCFPSLGQEETGSINNWFLSESGLPVQLTSDGAIFFPAAQLDATALVSALGCVVVWRRLKNVVRTAGALPSLHLHQQVRRRMLHFGLLHLVYALGDTLCEYVLWQKLDAETAAPDLPANSTLTLGRRDASWSLIYFVWLLLWSACVAVAQPHVLQGGHTSVNFPWGRS